VSFDRRLDRDIEAGDSSEPDGQGSTGFASGWMLLSPEGRRTRLILREYHGLCPWVSTPRRYLGNPHLDLGLTEHFLSAYFHDVGWQSLRR